MIYDNIAKACAEKNITIYRVERDLKLGNGIIGRWRNSMPTVDKFKAVADYLGKTMEELMK